MRLRAQRRHPEISTEELPVGYLDNYGQLPPPGENWAKRPDDELQSEELRRHIQSAVDALPEIYRTVFLLRDVEGLSTEETGEILEHLGADREDPPAPRAHRAARHDQRLLQQDVAASRRNRANFRYNPGRPMLIRRAATALVLCAVAVIGAGAARAASPYDDCWRRRRRGWRRSGRSRRGRARSPRSRRWRKTSTHGRWRPRFAAALGPGAHPLVAAHASWFLAHLLDQRGETKEAAALRASLGLLSHYFVIGPFGEGRASLNTPFPPEQEPAPPVAGRAATRERHTRPAGAGATRRCGTACCTWTACCVRRTRPSPTP